jgi:tetratricopeptide (TPR) repeat protein
MVMDYPFTFFTELLRKYPSSPWADNAEYLMFSYEEGSSHEGGDTGYNIEANEAYKKFIKRYPDSELIPEIYLRIAGLYFDYGTGQEDRKKYLEAAKVYTDKFYKEYPGHALTSEADQFLSYLDDELDKLHWSLTIQAGKTTYAKNEPVLITYTLRNGAPRPKTIKMYADTSYSNFSQYVTFSPIEAVNEGRYVMIEIYPQKLSSEMKEVIIQSGQTYTETKDMTKWVKAESFGNQGYYIMEQPGEYLVKAFFRYDNLNVQSNDLRIWRK